MTQSNVVQMFNQRDHVSDRIAILEEGQRKGGAFYPVVDRQDTYEFEGEQRESGDR